MLMVVFGAGASYDSAPTYPPDDSNPNFSGYQDRLPLADQLFDNRPEFVQALNRFPKVKPIVPYLRNRSDGTSIERELQRLQDEAAGYPEGSKQLAAVRYYLQLMLTLCERRWEENVVQGVTNQITLLDQIERWRDPNEQVCLVTFNYDTMLEAALRTVKVNIRAISDYVASDRYKLVKLHGSVNWGRQVEASNELLQRSAWGIANTLIDGADTLRITRNYVLVDQAPVHSVNKAALFPALAIPVESKLDFECPEEHLETLRAAISQVNKLIVIGWRAAETPFLEMLAQNLPGPIRGLVVAGNEEAAKETAERMLMAGVRGQFKETEGGFTDFVISREADDFLQR